MDMLLCPSVQLIQQHDNTVLHPAHSKPVDALQVYLASASPPVRYPNVYGVDMPTKREFVATDLSEEEIRKVCPHVSWSANYVAVATDRHHCARHMLLCADNGVMLQSCVHLRASGGQFTPCQVTTWRLAAFKTNDLCPWRYLW